MLAAIRHRGPDQEGTYTDQLLALGNVRLAVVALEGGRQPRVDDETGDALVFNGEIYGYQSLIHTLSASGVLLADRSDTEVLFQTIRRYGVGGALDRIDGMFAFAFRDGRTGLVYLARDRFGEKPLYYALRDGRLFFASELRAMLIHPRFSNVVLDAAPIFRYLTHEYMAPRETPFKDIAKLPPGCLLTFDGSNVEIATYWSPRTARDKWTPEVGQEGLRAQVDRLDMLLNDSIKERLIADVPIGVFLSGGVDSSLVASIAARHRSGLAAFTVRFPDSSYDETRFAEKVAKTYGLRHELIEMSEANLLTALNEIEEKLDEPFADASLVPTYLVCQAARKSVTVALGGDGGDELFAGYAPFKARVFSSLVSRWPRWSGRVVRRFLGQLPTSDTYMSWDFVLRQFANGIGIDPNLQCFYWMAAFTDEEKRGLVTSRCFNGMGEAQTFATMAERLRGSVGLHPIDRLADLFLGLYLPDDILFKLDRASMYNSLELRSPYLGRAFAEYALSMPPASKMRGLTTKVALKKLAEKYIGRDQVYRPKHGFNINLSELLRGPLHERVHDTLLDPDNPLACAFARREIERLLKEHATRARNHRKKIWTLYSLFRFASSLRASLAA